jgi:hypothetical protein
MKKSSLFGVIIVLTITLLLSSCSLGGLNLWSGFNDNDQEIAKTRMDYLLEALDNKDKDGLKAMFSKNAIDQVENFDQSITDLFDYYEGDFVSYDNWGGPVTEEGINSDGTGRKWKRLDSTCDVKTSNGEYRFAIIEFVQDTADADNVGVWSLYIIKMEDDNDPEYAYWGDGKDTPGINIGVPRAVLPE